MPDRTTSRRRVTTIPESKRILLMIDSHGRQIDYLRLAVTDRCNLRCFYCMPEQGIDYAPRKELLTYEEMLRLCMISSDLGVKKLRITGGEPFVRKDLIHFLERVQERDLFEETHITTNGVLTQPFLTRLKAIGINQLNLSLDTLDRKRFYEITRRDKFDAVMETLYQALDLDFKIKVNMVVMKGKNIEDISLWMDFIKEHPVSIRFIEEMPFNGSGEIHESNFWGQKDISDHVFSLVPDMEPITGKRGDTSVNYSVPGYKGSFGIIPAFSRTFCGSCNRLRITPKGILKTCLYDHAGHDLRPMLRSSRSDKEIAKNLTELVHEKYKDGFEAERETKSEIGYESMSTIGG